jgi:hypothetical protein
MPHSGRLRRERPSRTRLCDYSRCIELLIDPLKLWSFCLPTGRRYARPLRIDRVYLV